MLINGFLEEKKMSESRESKKERDRDRHRNRYDSNETNESMNILWKWRNWIRSINWCYWYGCNDNTEGLIFIAIQTPLDGL